ncbi:LLM class flavin-dependent oxidoreductase, partial [Leclercia adecarboxylata]|uniref:LLM class flavin-dependent oxidoreductase n=1 Tax=Leclercia adecarboxylata TaxID=83655 RepID=UPI00234E094A
MQLSILDLAPVCEGSDTTQAFANMLDLAQHAEGWGFHRYWLAEHHNMPGIASAATAVLIGHVAGGTAEDNLLVLGANGRAHGLRRFIRRLKPQVILVNAVRLAALLPPLPLAEGRIARPLSVASSVRRSNRPDDVY